MQERNNYIKYKDLMSMIQKDNIVLIFDSKNDVLSIIFLFCQEKYIAVTTSNKEYVRNVEVDINTSIGEHLRRDFIDPSKINAAYRINTVNGSIEYLYKKEDINMSLSEVEEKLGIVPGCLKIQK